MSEERLILAENPPETVLIDLVAALAALQAKSRSGILTRDDLELYLRSLDRAKAWIKRQPAEYQLTEAHLQLIMCEPGSSSAKTVLKLRHENGSMYIVMMRGGGWNSRICRIEVDFSHPFRKLKQKPIEVSCRGGAFFLDGMWTDPAPIGPAPAIPIGEPEDVQTEEEAAEADHVAQETLVNLEQPQDGIQALVYDPATSIIRMLHGTRQGEGVVVSIHPANSSGVRTITFNAMRSMNGYGTLWSDGNATGFDTEIPMEYLAPSLPDLINKVRQHIEKPTTLVQECQRCGHKALEPEDHYLRMIGKLCSEMGHLTWRSVEERMITSAEARKRQARKVKGDAEGWARTVVKLRATDQVLKNVAYTPNSIQRIMALHREESAKKNPRREVLAAVRKRLQELRGPAPLLLRLQSMTSVDVMDREPGVVLESFSAEQIDEALETLGFEVGQKIFLSLVEAPVLERWLTTARDAKDGLQHPTPPELAAAIIEDMLETVVAARAADVPPPSCSTDHQVAEAIAQHAVEELLSGKPSGVDPETAPYLLILSRRREDDAWNDPDVLGVYRDLGHGPDVIGELVRTVDTREIRLLSSAEPIPEYVQEVAVYLEKRGEHHDVPFVPFESRELAYQLAAGGAEIDTCEDPWALRLYILKMAQPERRQHAFKRLIKVYETDPHPPLRFSPYMPTEHDLQLCIAHYGPMGRPFSFAEPPKQDEYTGRFVAHSYGPVWGFATLPKPPRPPGQHRDLDDKLEDLETVRKWIAGIDHYEDLMEHGIERELEDRNRPAVLELLRAKFLELKRAPLWGHCVSEMLEQRTEERPGHVAGERTNRQWEYYYAAAPNCDSAQAIIEKALGRKLEKGKVSCNPFWCVMEDKCIELLVTANLPRFDHRGVALVGEGEPTLCQVCSSSASTFLEQRHDLELRIIGPHRDTNGNWCGGEAQIVGAELDQWLLRRVKDSLNSYAEVIKRCGMEKGRGPAAHHLLELTLPHPSTELPDVEPPPPLEPMDVATEEQRIVRELAVAEHVAITCPWCQREDANVRRPWPKLEEDPTGTGIICNHFDLAAYDGQPCPMEGRSFTQARDIVVDVLERGKIVKPFERYSCPMKGCGKFIKLQVLHGRAVLSPHQDASRHRCEAGNITPTAAWDLRRQHDAKQAALQDRRNLEPDTWVARAREMRSTDHGVFQQLTEDSYLMPIEWFIDRARALIPTFKDPHDICPCCRGRYWRNPANARHGRIVWHTKPGAAGACEGQGYSFEKAAAIAMGTFIPVTTVVLRKGTRAVPGTLIKTTDASCFVRWESEPGEPIEHSFDRVTGKARGCSIATLEIHWWTLELDYTTTRPSGRGDDVSDPAPWTERIAADVPARRFVTLRHDHQAEGTRGEILGETTVGGSPCWDVQWLEPGKENPTRHLFNKSYGSRRGDNDWTIDLDHRKDPIPWLEPGPPAEQLEPEQAPEPEPETRADFATGQFGVVFRKEVDPPIEEPVIIREDHLLKSVPRHGGLFDRILALCNPDGLEPHHRKIFQGMGDEQVACALIDILLANDQLREATEDPQPMVILYPMLYALLDDLSEARTQEASEPVATNDHVCALCKKQIPRYHEGGGIPRFVEHRVEGDGWYYSFHQEGWTRCLGTMRTAAETRELAADTRPWVGWRVLYRWGADSDAVHGHWISAQDERWALTFHQDRYLDKRLVVVGTVPQEDWIFALDDCLRCGTSPNRWKTIREEHPEGIDDPALLEQIREEWGTKRSTKSGGGRGWVGWAKVGGKCPTFEALSSVKGDSDPIRVLRGHELVQAVRALLELPNPNPLARVPDQKGPKTKAKKDSSFSWGESWLKGAEIERGIYDLYAVPVFPDPHGNDCFVCPVCQHKIDARFQSFAIKLFRHNTSGKMFPRDGEGEECRGSDQSLALAHLIARGEYPPVIHLPDPPEVVRTLEDGTVVLSEQCLICDYPVEVLRDMKRWPDLYCSEKYSSDEHGEGCEAAGREIFHVFNDRVRSLTSQLGGIHERNNSRESWEQYRQQMAAWRGQTEEDRAELQRRREEEQKRKGPEPEPEEEDDLEDDEEGLEPEEGDAADSNDVSEPAAEPVSAAPIEAELDQNLNHVIHEAPPVDVALSQSAEPAPSSSPISPAQSKKKGRARATDPNQLSLFKI